MTTGTVGSAYTPLEIAGKSLKLVLNFDAMCLWESLTGKSSFADMPNALGSLQGGRLILFVMLQKYHDSYLPEPKDLDKFYKSATSDAVDMGNIKLINDALALELARSWGLNQKGEEQPEKKGQALQEG